MDRRTYGYIDKQRTIDTYGMDGWIDSETGGYMHRCFVINGERKTSIDRQTDGRLS